MKIDEEAENDEQTHDDETDEEEVEEEDQDELDEKGSQESDNLTVLTSKLMDEILGVGEKTGSSKLTFDIPF
jgi:hypothetical protein